MTEILRAKTVAQASALFESFHEMCAGPTRRSGRPTEDLEDDMERLQVLSGVRLFPMRVKCATLAWHTMRAAMDGKGEVSTEDED